MTPRGSAKPGPSTPVCCHAPDARKVAVVGAFNGHYHGCPKDVPNPFGTMNRVIEVQA